MPEAAFTTAGIEAALALIETPQQWTKIAAARAADGTAVEFWDERAISFCFVSALYRVSAAPHEEAAVRALVPGGMIGLWNDHSKREHADVIKIGRLAIAAIERDRTKAERRAARRMAGEGGTDV